MIKGNNTASFRAICKISEITDLNRLYFPEYKYIELVFVQRIRVVAAGLGVQVSLRHPEPGSEPLRRDVGRRRGRALLRPSRSLSPVGKLVPGLQQLHLQLRRADLA